MNSSCETTLLALAKILSQYAWLLDSYNVDYFLSEHWEKIPKTWTAFLNKVDKHDIPSLLIGGNETKYLYPLTFLCLRTFSSLARKKRSILTNENLPFHNEKPANNSDLKLRFSKESSLPLRSSDHILARGIKLKKRHEIERLCEIIPPLMQSFGDSMDIIDCGSGQGHLSRILSLCYGYRVHCIEANCDNVAGALNHDNKVLNALRKHNFTDKSSENMPSKVNCFLTTENRIDKLVSVDKTCAQHLLLGLHACGELSNLILEEFARNPNSNALVLVCCCYMKSDQSRFPMSKFLAGNMTFILSTEAKELACHAMEKFLQKFNNKELESLKIHGYRACLEALIEKYVPSKRHTAMRSVKIDKSTSFRDYVGKAIRGLGFDIPDEALECDLVKKWLEQLDRVVIYYSLRLLVAPLVELFILLDYQQYLSEQIGVKRTYLLSLFEPSISPRNLVLIAHK